MNIWGEHGTRQASMLPTEWDRDMAEKLLPLAKDQWVHHALFFANTFPLAYHYAWALFLRRKDKNPQEVIGNYLRISQWKEEPKGEKVFWYNTKPEEDTYPFIPVTRFLPKYVFVQKTLATVQIKEKILQKSQTSRATRADRERNPDFFEFLENTDRAYDAIDIYSELKELGEFLKKKIDAFYSRYPKLQPKPTVTVFHNSAEGLPLLTPFVRIDSANQQENHSSNARLPHSTLRLFIYGGPLSSYLVRKKTHYIATEITAQGENDDEPNLVTGIALSKKCDEAIANALRNYHRSLYKDAEKVTRIPSWGLRCPPFYSVCRAYNETAWLLQHRSSFTNAKEFATCLKEHNGAVTMVTS